MGGVQSPLVGSVSGRGSVTTGGFSQWEGQLGSVKSLTDLFLDVLDAVLCCLLTVHHNSIHIPPHHLGEG